MRYCGENALGLIETRALVPAIKAADTMLKTADVELTAFEAGGSTLVTVFVTGDVAACRSSVAAGAAEAEKIGLVTAKNVMPRPIRPVCDIVNAHELERTPLTPGYSDKALGLLETFGVVHLMEAADAMVKAADVELEGYENIYDGYVSVLVRGDVQACETAVAAGDKAVRALGVEPYSAIVIPRPHPQLQWITDQYSMEFIRAGQFAKSKEEEHAR